MEQRVIYEVFRGRNGWRYRVVARNGEIVEASQKYASKSNAVRAARKRGKVRVV